MIIHSFDKEVCVKAMSIYVNKFVSGFRFILLSTYVKIITDFGAPLCVREGTNRDYMNLCIFVTPYSKKIAFVSFDDDGCENWMVTHKVTRLSVSF